MKTNQTFPKVCPRKFPFKAVCGHSIAAMYRVRDKGYDVFRIPYKDDKGQRQFHRFANYEDARAKGNEMLDQMKRGNAAALTLTNTDKVIYTRAVESLRPLNIKLDTAVLQYVEAVKALNGVDVSIAEAARSYAKRYPAKMPAKMVLDVVKEFVEAKEASKRSVRYIDDLKYRLGYPQDGTRKRKRGFADAFPMKIGRIDRMQLQAFLDDLKLSPRSYNNFRGALISLFEFAKRRKYLPDDWNEFAGIDTVKDNGGAIEIFAPEEIARLLSHASEQLIPFLAIGAFAGLRSAEIERLDWHDVRFDSGFIVVEKGKAKTAARRVVPVTENLKAWLKPYAKSRGEVWGYGQTYLYHVLRETTAATGIEADLEKRIEALEPVQWKQNALRHSYISYRVADVQDVNKVALEAGNSPAMIFSNYRELVAPQDAKKWFAIMPNEEASSTPT